MKTSELQGAALDWAVAQCETPSGGYKDWVQRDLEKGLLHGQAYSTDWLWGGPIIEREGICLSCVDTMAEWDARIYDGESEPWQGEGPTPLIAAMRCYVASRIGDEVEIPDVLMEQEV